MSLPVAFDDLSADTLRDELVQLPQPAAAAPDSVPARPVRFVNLILDHSAFIRGIGNIKRWFSSDYIRANRSPSDPENIVVCIYVPAFTLHEFDYAKKGTSMMATNAREAIRFIDKLVEHEYHMLVPESPAEAGTCFRLVIEGPKDAGPEWNKCAKFKVHTPKIKEFPNYKTMFDNNRMGLRPLVTDVDDFTSPDHFSGNPIQYENSASYQLAVANSENTAEMPKRLRYLMRLCIFKRYIEKHEIKDLLEEWKVVTEDAITRIWTRSFGMECINVNEAELLMFEGYDVSGKRSTPHDYMARDEGFTRQIDTTQYKYMLVNGHSGSRNKQWVQAEKTLGVNGEYVRKERFDAINYAPRGDGKLWKRKK